MNKLLASYAILIGLFTFYFYSYQSAEKQMLENKAVSFSENAKEKYVMVTFQAGIEYWKGAIKGFEDAANELNVSIEYRGAPQIDVYEQITVLEQVIARKPAGIALSAVDAIRLNSTINQAVEAGIPVVLFDADAPGSKASLFLGTDNEEAGAKAAHEMAAMLGRSGEVAVITAPGQLNLKERTEGFAKTIKNHYPNMKLAAVANGQRDQMATKQVVLDLIKKNPNIKGFFSTEANGGAGIAAAAQSANKSIFILGFDTDRETLNLIKKGFIHATIAQGTREMGYQSLQFLVKLHRNEKINIPARINTGVTIVTKENVENYYTW